MEYVLVLCLNTIRAVKYDEEAYLIFDVVAASSDKTKLEEIRNNLISILKGAYKKKYIREYLENEISKLNVKFIPGYYKTIISRLSKFIKYDKEKDISCRMDFEEGVYIIEVDRIEGDANGTCG